MTRTRPAPVVPWPRRSSCSRFSCSPPKPSRCVRLDPLPPSVSSKSARRGRTPSRVRPPVQHHPCAGRRVAGGRSARISRRHAGRRARAPPAHRFIVVVADGVPQAERLLADLHTLIDEAPVALYPPREGFGEVEPHVEVAGERVETLERLSRGEIRVLLTTPRALLERTRLAGRARRPAHRAAQGRRAPTARARGASRVDRVRARADGGGRRAVQPARRHLRRLLVRHGRSRAHGVLGRRDRRPAALRALLAALHARRCDLALVLPVDGQVREEATTGRAPVRLGALPARHARSSIRPGTHLLPELQRTWDEAAHHIDLARRRGEDADSREELFESPQRRRRRARRVRRAAAASIRPREQARRRVPASAAGAHRPRHQAAAAHRARRACRRHPLRQRGAGRAARRAARRGRARAVAARRSSSACWAAASSCRPDDRERGLRVLTDHEIFRRERRIRRARRYVSGAASTRSRSSRATTSCISSTASASIAASRRIFVGQSTIEVAVVEYEGGDRLNVPLYRIDQLERYRSADDVSDDAPPPRLHKLGGKRWAQQRDRTRAAIQEMTHELLDLYARRKVASRPPHVPDTAWQRQLESSFLFEDTPDQRKATDGGEGRHGEHAADGSPARRRRRLRQDGDRGARRVQGGAERAAGRRARADDHPRRPACAHLRRAARRLSRSASP